VCLGVSRRYDGMLLRTHRRPPHRSLVHNHRPPPPNTTAIYTAPHFRHVYSSVHYILYIYLGLCTISPLPILLDTYLYLYVHRHHELGVAGEVGEVPVEGHALGGGAGLGGGEGDAQHGVGAELALAGEGGGSVKLTITRYIHTCMYTYMYIYIHVYICMCINKYIYI